MKFTSLVTAAAVLLGSPLQASAQITPFDLAYDGGSTTATIAPTGSSIVSTFTVTDSSTVTSGLTAVYTHSLGIPGTDDNGDPSCDFTSGGNADGLTANSPVVDPLTPTTLTATITIDLPSLVIGGAYYTVNGATGTIEVCQRVESAGVVGNTVEVEAVLVTANIMLTEDFDSSTLVTLTTVPVDDTPIEANPTVTETIELSAVSSINGTPVAPSLNVLVSEGDEICVAVSSGVTGVTVESFVDADVVGSDAATIFPLVVTDNAGTTTVVGSGEEFSQLVTQICASGTCTVCIFVPTSFLTEQTLTISGTCDVTFGVTTTTVAPGRRRALQESSGTGTFSFQFDTVPPSDSSSTKSLVGMATTAAMGLAAVVV